MLFLYEEESLAVTEELVGQYLSHERVVREFMAYYDLYCKYKKDYHIREILQGSASEDMRRKAENAPFDERISLLGMLTDKTDGMLRDCMEKTDYLENLLQVLKHVKSQMGIPAEKQGQAAVPDDQDGQRGQNAASDGHAASGCDGISAAEAFSIQIAARERLLASLSAANALSAEDKRMHQRVLAFLREQKRSLLLEGEQPVAGEQFAAIRRAFEQEAACAKQETAQAKQCLHHLFSFVEQVFADGNELLLLVTHMTVTDCCAGFVARFGCEDYERHSKELMLSERRETLLREMEELEL